MKKIKEDIYNFRYSILGVIAYIIFMEIVFSELCPVKALLGINCPGCGLTHASLFLLKGQFLNAMQANYTVILWWLLIILFIIDRYIHKMNKYIVPSTAIITFVVTIARYMLILAI